MLIRVIDFETTGMPPDAAVCEVAWRDVVDEDGDYDIGDGVSMLVNPGRPVALEAMAVHHIRDHELADRPPPDVAFLQLMDGATIFVAHNASFEQQFFAGGGKPWICTYRCALRAWPDSPGHSNQVLRYFLQLDLDDRAMPPHRAAPDAFVTAHILLRLLDAHPLDQLIAWSAEPALMVLCRFGKHRGAKWSEVPSDYLEWILRQDMDADTKHTARHHLSQRKK